MSYYNEYSRSSASFGGHLSVFVREPEKVEGGGFLKNTGLVKGEILSAGSPVAYDPHTHDAKILRIWQVKAAEVVDTDYTKVTVYYGGNIPQIHATDVVMVLGSTLAATGKAALAGDIDLSVAYEASFTVLTAALDSVTVGAFIVQSSSATAGSGKSIYCIPTSLTTEDTVIGDQNTVDIARGPKYVYKNVIARFHPAIVAAAIPMIDYAHYPELQGSGYIA